MQKLHNKWKEGMDSSFEYKTRVKKSSEPPWMADWIREIIKDRRKIFHTDKGRSPRWQKQKKRTRRIVKERKKTIMMRYYLDLITRLIQGNSLNISTDCSEQMPSQDGHLKHCFPPYQGKKWLKSVPLSLTV